VEYVASVDHDAGFGNLETGAPCAVGVAPPDMVAAGAIGMSADVSGTAWPVLPI
jgi:hypothetical protein